MRPRAELLLRPPRPSPNMAVVLAQLERSGCDYFVKTLSQTAIQARKTKRTAMLTMPAQFVRENADKIEQWIILRTHWSCGGNGRPWVVRLSVTEGGKVFLCGGLYDFVAGNRLKEGDSLIFVLQEDARSEFAVYKFHASPEDPLYPEEGDSSGDSASEDNSHSSFPSPLHHENERKKAFTRDTRKRKATPSQFDSHFDYHGVHKKEFTSDTREGTRARPAQYDSDFDYHRVHKKVPTGDTRKGTRTRPLPKANHWQNHRGTPSFRKRMTASNIARSDRHPSSNSGQFGFPERFLRVYRKQVHTSVKLQGIYEDSPTYVISCRERPGMRLKLDLSVTGWSRFVKENGLEKGDDLEFLLMADSYFVVRKVY